MIGATRWLAVRALARADTYSRLPRSFDVLLYCHDNDRALERDGKAYSQMLDPTGDRLAARGYDVRSVAAPPSLLTGERAHRRPVSIARGLLTAFAVDRISRLRGARGQPDGAARRRFWRRLLEKHRPRIVVGIGLPKALLAAAKEIDVPAVEVMHGFGLPQDDPHHGVAALSRIPDEELPGAVVTFDRVTYGTYCAGLRGKATSVYLCSAPFSDLEWLCDDLAASLERLRPGNRPDGVEHVVLLTLQYGYAGEWPHLAGIIENGILYEEFEKAIAEDRSIFWLLKAHPVQLRGPSGQRVREFLAAFAARHPNVEWEETSKAPLASLFGVCDVHVTMFSGTAYEAAMAGIPSAACCPTVRPGGCQQSWFEDLVAEGWVTKDATDAEKLRSWIVANGAQKRAEAGSSSGPGRDLPSLAEVLDGLLGGPGKSAAPSVKPDA